MNAMWLFKTCKNELHTPTTMLPSTPSHQLRLEVPTPLHLYFFLFSPGIYN
jgi:hypothetical protein